MINYVVNFDEIEKELADLLNNLSKKRTDSNIEFFNKEQTFVIPPIKGEYFFEIPLTEEDYLEYIDITIDGFNQRDSIKIELGNNENGEIFLCYSNRRLRFSSIQTPTIKINYKNDGGYKNLKIALTLINKKEE